MNTFDTTLSIDQIRRTWMNFQSEALNLEPTPEGVAIAMPQTLPDGWQMVVELQVGTPNKVKLSDGGRTLGWMASRGQNIETNKVRDHVLEIRQQTGMEQDGWVLYRWLDLPVQGVDLHLFAESLSSIAHLYYLHETTPREVDLSERSLRRVFTDRHITPLENHPLDGKTERAVRLDFFVPSTKPVAFQILRRRGRVQSTMEQWGYRWQDLRKVHTELQSAMIYDPTVQNIDEAARAIGEEVCTLFCSYEETDRIHELLDRAQINE